MKKKNEKAHLMLLTKETPEARKKRVSGGIRLCAAAFDSKKRREESRKPRFDKQDWENM